MQLAVALSLAPYRRDRGNGSAARTVVAGPRGPILLDEETGGAHELLTSLERELPRTWHVQARAGKPAFNDASKDARESLNLTIGDTRELLRYAWDQPLRLLKRHTIPYAGCSLAVAGGYWFVNIPFEGNSILRVDDETGETEPFEYVRTPTAWHLAYHGSWHWFRRRLWKSPWGHAAVAADAQRVYVGFTICPFCVAIHDHDGHVLDVLGPDRVDGAARGLDDDMKYGRVAIWDIALRPQTQALYLLVADVPRPQLGLLDEDGRVHLTRLPAEAVDARRLVWLDDNRLALCTLREVLIYAGVP